VPRPRAACALDGQRRPLPYYFWAFLPRDFDWCRPFSGRSSSAKIVRFISACWTFSRFTSLFVSRTR